MYIYISKLLYVIEILGMLTTKHDLGNTIPREGKRRVRMLNAHVRFLPQMWNQSKCVTLKLRFMLVKAKKSFVKTETTGPHTSWTSVRPIECGMSKCFKNLCFLESNVNENKHKKTDLNKRPHLAF
jgi:hypothetical protein